MKKFGKVFSSNTLKLEVDVFAHNKEKPTKFVELIETTGASISSDLNVDERDVFNDTFKRRTATGGKAFDIKFTSILSPDNEAHKFLREIAFSEDITKHNYNKFKFTFPYKDENGKQRTEEYNGVLKFDSVGPGESLDLAKLEYTLMVSGSPNIKSVESVEFTPPTITAATGKSGAPNVDLTINNFDTTSYKLYDENDVEVNQGDVINTNSKNYKFTAIAVDGKAIDGLSTIDYTYDVQS